MLIEYLIKTYFHKRNVGDLLCRGSCRQLVAGTKGSTGDCWFPVLHRAWHSICKSSRQLCCLPLDFREVPSCTELLEQWWNPAG